jgi:phosphoribosylformylglycinamidine cyclo-ligase
MSAACTESNIALVGGETAEMPSVYAPGDLDVVGFVTGVVDRSQLLTGANIVEGDLLYGVRSTGLHTNGWSLARKLLFEVNQFDIHAPQPELQGAALADILLEPHANYVTPIRRALDAHIPIRGMAHITGGGLIENTPRILPAGLGAVIDRTAWKPQEIFTWMQKLGHIPDEEMHRVFNMGIGLVVIAPAGHYSALAEAFAPFSVSEIGRVDSDTSGVRFTRGA